MSDIGLVLTGFVAAVLLALLLWAACRVLRWKRRVDDAVRSVNSGMWGNSALLAKIHALPHPKTLKAVADDYYERQREKK